MPNTEPESAPPSQTGESTVLPRVKIVKLGKALSWKWWRINRLLWSLWWQTFNKWHNTNHLPSLGSRTPCIQTDPNRNSLSQWPMQSFVLLRRSPQASCGKETRQNQHPVVSFGWPRVGLVVIPYDNPHRWHNRSLLSEGKNTVAKQKSGNEWPSQSIEISNNPLASF